MNTLIQKKHDEYLDDMLGLFSDLKDIADGIDDNKFGEVVDTFKKFKALTLCSHRTLIPNIILPI